MEQEFCCDACAARQDLDLLCRETASPVTLLCVQCCGCGVHHGDLDMPGTVIFAGTPLTWRRLHDSPHRTRRHA